MKFIKKNAFTLIELLISITILSILATVAFNSYTWYLSSSRDSVRTIDIKGLNKSLRIFPLYNWFYPVPSDWEIISYSNASVWTQWIIWQSVIFLLDEVEKIPLDPLTWNKYSYSVTTSWKEYEIGAILENGSYSYNNILETANAWTISALAYTVWNFNWIVSQVRIWTTDYIISTPSIITSSIDKMENVILNNSFVFDWLSNLPASYTWSDFNLEWSNDLTFLNSSSYDPIVFNWCVSDLRQDENYDANRWVILNLQDLYSWTDIANNKKIQNLLEIDTSTWSTELLTYMEYLYNKLSVIPWCGEAIYYCTTQDYIHANYISWIATEINQAWQTDSWSPCYYTCTDSYSWDDCATEPVEEWVCWIDNWTSQENTPINLCDGWELTDFTDNLVWSTYEWYCRWTGWAADSPNCSAYHIENWDCWYDHTLAFTTEPTNLCDAWTPSWVADSWTPWTWDWTCDWIGTNATSENCWADHVESIDWVCWDDKDQDLVDEPTLLCNAWTTEWVSDGWVGWLWSWTCDWIDWWAPASCTANHVAPPVNWVCWNDHESDQIEDPIYLCGAWTVELYNDGWENNQFTWECHWTDWWSDEPNCWANHVPEIIGLQLTYNGLVDWDVLELPFNGTVNITKIDWGDSWVNWCPTTASLWTSCTYTDASLIDYVIKIYWISSGFGSSLTAGIEKLVSIDKWDELWITNLAYIWAWAINLTSVPSYLPVWVTNLKHMFNDADSFNQDIASFATWTVDVIDMDYMFSQTEIFNQNISSWSVANVDSILKFDFNSNASWEWECTLQPQWSWETCP